MNLVSRQKPRQSVGIQRLRQPKIENPDKNPDKMSGFGGHFVKEPGFCQQSSKFRSMAGFQAQSPPGEILNDLLEKYATDGELQFTVPDVLKFPPISNRGNVNEIIGKVGGADQLRNAVNQLQLLLYTS